MIDVKEQPSINCDDIWKKLVASKQLSALPKKEQGVLKPYIQEIPNVLKDKLVEQVSLKGICLARQLFLQYCLENSLPERMASASFLLKVVYGNQNKATQKLKTMSQQLVGELKVISDDPAAYMEKNRVSEQAALALFGLSDQNVRKFVSGELTLADVLVSQPWLFTKTTL